MDFSSSIDKVSSYIIEHTAYKSLIIGLAEKLASENNDILDLCSSKKYEKYIREANKILSDSLIDKVLES